MNVKKKHVKLINQNDNNPAHNIYIYAKGIVEARSSHQHHTYIYRIIQLFDEIPYHIHENNCVCVCVFAFFFFFFCIIQCHLILFFSIIILFLSQIRNPEK